LSKLRGHIEAGRIKQIKKSNDLTENRTRDLPACSLVTQTVTATNIDRFERVEYMPSTYFEFPGIISPFEIRLSLYFRGFFRTYLQVHDSTLFVCPVIDFVSLSFLQKYQAIKFTELSSVTHQLFVVMYVRLCNVCTSFHG
jgi:hypothetical protein